MTQTSTETIKALQDSLIEKDAEIARLKRELQILQHRTWVSDACGDDLWERQSESKT